MVEMSAWAATTAAARLLLSGGSVVQLPKEGRFVPGRGGVLEAFLGALLSLVTVAAEAVDSLLGGLLLPVRVKRCSMHRVWSGPCWANATRTSC